LQGETSYNSSPLADAAIAAYAAREQAEPLPVVVS
jgi:hypothetical protein